MSAMLENFYDIFCHQNKPVLKGFKHTDDEMWQALHDSIIQGLQNGQRDQP